MDIHQLLCGVDCACGRKHTCGISYVYIEPKAISHLTAIAEDYHRLLIVADRNTERAAGERVRLALKGKELHSVLFDGDTVLVPNEAAIAAVTEALDGCDLIVGIGSGVIQDLCKYVSHQSGCPYVIVATAPSMDGYASTGAAMIIGGMKVTYSVGLPMAILADTEVLKEAPIEMIKAGYGDIVGKYSSLNDWRLSHAINGEYYCESIYQMTKEQLEHTLSLTDGLLKRNEESIRALTEALVVIGILLSFAGSSRPASGSEHHLSHFFEITGLVCDEPYLPHGIDVAYSSVITAALRERLCRAPFPRKLCRLSEADYRTTMQTIYREVAAGCIELQKKVGNYAADRLPTYLEKEAEIKAILAEMPRADEIVTLLARVELPMADFYRFYSKEKIENAVRYAKDLKDRYTVLWLYYDLYGEEPLCLPC